MSNYSTLFKGDTHIPRKFADISWMQFIKQEVFQRRDTSDISKKHDWNLVKTPPPNFAWAYL